MFLLCKVAVAFLYLFVQSSVNAQSVEAPYGLSYSVTDSVCNFLWYYPGINNQTYPHDLETGDNYYYVSDQNVGGRVVVEFAEVPAGIGIESILIFLWGGDPFADLPGDMNSPFEAAIFDHLPTNVHEGALWGPFLTLADEVPPQGGWTESAVNKRFPAAETLLVEFRWLAGTPTAPLLALNYQTDNLHTYFGYLSFDQVIWSRENNGNALVHLKCNMPDTLAGFRHPANLPDSFLIYLAADSLECRQTQEVHLSIRDSLHCSFVIDEVDDRFMSVAAVGSGIIGPRTIPMPVTRRQPFPLSIIPESLLVLTDLGEMRNDPIIIENSTDDDILYSLTLTANFQSDWLHFDTAQSYLPGLASDTINLAIDNGNVASGKHETQITIHCQGSREYESQIFRVINHIDQATSIREADYLPRSSAGPDQNHPNPFNQMTVIRSSSSEVIEILNILGEKIKVIQKYRRSGEGDFVFEWNGTDAFGNDLASGVYFYRQRNSSVVRKMVLSK